MSSLVPSRLLSFMPSALQVLRVLPTPDQVAIEAIPRRDAAECPICGMTSRHVHSGYVRVLQDLPWQGRPVRIRLATRRFRCVNVACRRKTFAERLTDVAQVSARRTGRLGGLQRHLALALGGEAGARLASRLALPTSPDTLLRLACKPTDDAIATATPRVLGVDDWAWRRGHHYGTMLVDLEENQVIDLLGDRTAATLATWLRAHPGVEIVARDRAGAYADGIRQGTPEALQVADRWHLLHNLGDAVQALADRHSTAATRAAQDGKAHLLATTAQPPAASPAPEPRHPTRVERASAASFQRRQARYEEAARLKREGASVRSIATRLGIERKTVRRWLRLGHAPTWKKPPRGSILAPHADFLQRRWVEGCHNAARLWRDLVGIGFTGRPGVVRRWAAKRRRAEPATATPVGAAQRAAFAWTVPVGRHLARLLMADNSDTSKPDAGFVTRLLAEVPALGITIDWGKHFAAMLRHAVKANLDDVLAAGDSTLLASFVAGLRKDFDAIKAALESPWTTSPVEGQISRLKMLKRTMYGRASIQLLRARVLHAP